MWCWIFTVRSVEGGSLMLSHCGVFTNTRFSNLFFVKTEPRFIGLNILFFNSGGGDRSACFFGLCADWLLSRLFLSFLLVNAFFRGEFLVVAYYNSCYSSNLFFIKRRSASLLRRLNTEASPTRRGEATRAWVRAVGGEAALGLTTIFCSSS